MCIFSSQIQQMSKARIFVASMKDRTRQLTVISNQVKLAGKNRVVMIIPVINDPIAENGGIELFDFSSYKHVFNDMSSFFPVNPKDAHSKAKLISDLEKSLPQEKFGTYEVSVARDLEELEKYINNSGIQMNKYVSELLSEKYLHYFGFVICKIYKSANFYPIGFTSPMMDQQYYIPTLFFDGSDFDMKPSWDHEIYVTNRRRPPAYQKRLSGIDSEDCKIKGKVFELKTKRVENRLPKGIEIDKIYTLWQTKINTFFEQNVNFFYRQFRIEENGNFKNI